MLHPFKVFPLSVARLFEQQYVDEAPDGIQRCAQFVADQGQETGFEPRFALCQFLLLGKKIAMSLPLRPADHRHAGDYQQQQESG